MPPPNMIMKTTKQSLLPQEIIEAILARLPVKSLLKFRCVSKSFLSLIDSKHFIIAHFQNSKKNTSFPHQRVIFNHNGLKQFSLHSFLNDEFSDPSNLNDPIYSSSRSARVVGCSGGLVCIIEKSMHFFLWNPSTKMTKKLPQIDHGNDQWKVMSRGFGWDESGRNYKIFAVVCDPRHLIGKLYSSETNSWKTVQHEDLGLEFEYHVGQFFRGNLHWLNSRKYDIVCFNLKREAFGIVKQPFNHGELRRFPWLGVLGEHLCLVCNEPSTNIDVWVMKEYGAEGSWEKLVAIRRVLDELRPFQVPFVVGPNGEIMIFYGSTFLIYYSKENVIRIPNKIEYFTKGHHYIENLISPVLRG